MTMTIIALRVSLVLWLQCISLTVTAFSSSVDLTLRIQPSNLRNIVAAYSDGHQHAQHFHRRTCDSRNRLWGWVQGGVSGKWEWRDDVSDDQLKSKTSESPGSTISTTSATPKLPSGTYRPKQSLGQNYLQDPNTVSKIIRAFHQDAYPPSNDSVLTSDSSSSTGNDDFDRFIELGPGAGALTDRLVQQYGAERFLCIEIDERSVQILLEKHPQLDVLHDDVLQIDYAAIANQYNHGKPVAIIGNLPYYITSQILFALADASHAAAVRSATVTMQWEVAQRMVALPNSKDYGILSVVFQLYAKTRCHFKIPPTVFYPQPKVDSALVGLHFLALPDLYRRLAGVQPNHLRRVVTTAFQQRRKTVRNSLRKLVREVFTEQRKQQQHQQIQSDHESQDSENEDINNHDHWNELLLMQEKLIFEATTSPVLPRAVLQAQEAGDVFARQQALPLDWPACRPEQFTPGQFVELTRLIFGPKDPSDVSSAVQNDSSIHDWPPLGLKVWRKLKHGTT